MFKKPKTQRRCFKPGTQKQKQQRALAWMLFRVTGMQITGNLCSLKLSHNLLYHIHRFQDQRLILEKMIRKELQDL